MVKIRYQVIQALTFLKIHEFFLDLSDQRFNMKGLFRAHILPENSFLIFAFLTNLLHGFAGLLHTDQHFISRIDPDGIQILNGSLA